MDFSILAFGAAGPLNGNLTRVQTRSILGMGFHKLRKTAASLNTTDAFAVLDLHVYYDEKDIVKGVEFFLGSNVSWQGHSMVGESMSTVLTLFRREGLEPVLDDDGFQVDAFGMIFYVPDGDDTLIKAL